MSIFTDELDRIVREESVDTFILGCTELPILFEKFNLDYKYVDPTQKYLLKLWNWPKDI